MPQLDYDPTWTLQRAKAFYFAANNFGEDGGYNDAWVDFMLGPIPFPFPNTQGRVRALAVHDLHHIVTGYQTDLRGELEISAWELGAGCKDFYAAWFLNLAGLAGGLFLAPIRVFRAFVRGVNSHSLYGEEVSALLAKTVGETKAELRTDAPPASPRAVDVARFAGFGAAGLVCMTAFMGMGVVLAPIGLAVSFWRRKKTRAESESSRVAAQSQPSRAL